MHEANERTLIVFFSRLIPMIFANLLSDIR